MAVAENADAQDRVDGDGEEHDEHGVEHGKEGGDERVDEHAQRLQPPENTDDPEGSQDPQVAHVRHL